jgi:hypothetical protein
MASANDSTQRRDASKMLEMTRKSPHSPSGIPSRRLLVGGGTAAEVQAAWTRIAERLQREPPGPTNERITVAGPIDEQMRLLGGRPRGSNLTDGALRAELAKGLTRAALAAHFGVTDRHIRRRVQRLMSR